MNECKYKCLANYSPERSTIKIPKMKEKRTRKMFIL